MTRPDLKLGDIIATHDGGFVSRRIRAITNGWSNHVAICIAPHSVAEATMGPGVGLTSVEAMLLHNRPAVIVRPCFPDGTDYVFDDVYAARFHNFVMGCLKDNYDTAAVFAFMFGFSIKNAWNDPKGWFCSELVTAALAAGGFNLFNQLQDAAFVSPTMCATAGRVKPIWHQHLPSKVVKLMDLEWIPHA